MNLNIVILEGQLVNPGDLSWDPIEKLGNLEIYPSTPLDQVIERSKDAGILIVNKIKFNKALFNKLPKLKLICLLATGYDNVNIKDANAAGITVCNAVGYGVDSVAQHVFALLLTITNKVALHNQSIQNKEWVQHPWSYTLGQIKGLAGKTIGIVGFGKIGRKVAEIAIAIGMNVIAFHKHPERDATNNVQFVSINELCSKSDVISLHAPLNTDTKDLINVSTLKLMRKSAILINTGRGGLINEEDLREFLLETPTFVAALDVLSQEPAPNDHPLIGLDNCIVTPHNAWSNIDARRRLIEIVGENISGFLDGVASNVVS